VKALFAPKQPEAKQTYSEKDKKWAMGMLTQPTQYKMNLPSDYDREISKQSVLFDEKKKNKCKKQETNSLAWRTEDSIGPPAHSGNRYRSPSKPIWIRTTNYWTP
jgi:hypothetical protein